MTSPEACMPPNIPIYPIHLIYTLCMKPCLHVCIYIYIYMSLSLSLSLYLALSPLSICPPSLFLTYLGRPVRRNIYSCIYHVHHKIYPLSSLVIIARQPSLDLSPGHGPPTGFPCEGTPDVRPPAFRAFKNGKKN